MSPSTDRLTVINLWGGPGSGKSTTAAGLFFLMKCAGYKVELVTEYAKDLTYEHDWVTRRDQWVVSGVQYHRQRRLIGEVDFAITDSPLLLGLFYGRRDGENLEKRLKADWADFDNINFFIERVKPYQPYGRSQNESRARGVDAALEDLIWENDIPMWRVIGDETAPATILNNLENGYGITPNTSRS